jgi:hypothetical protein
MTLMRVRMRAGQCTEAEGKYSLPGIDSPMALIGHTLLC